MVNVLIADDHEIVREGLTQILNKEFSIKVIGQAKDGIEAVNLSNKLKPDIVIMDIGMPLLNGIEAAKQITNKNKNTKIIILSMYGDNDTVIRAIESGISGFVLKNSASNELIDAIYKVSQKKSYISPEISSEILEKIRYKNTKETNKLDILTMKEKHIIQLIAEGYSTKKIATMLGISFHTVKTHRNNIMEKLNLHNVAKLTQFALSNKLTL